MTREALRDGYVRLMQDVYQPGAYFERLQAFTGTPTFQFAPSRARYLREHFFERVMTQIKYWAGSAFIFLQLMRLSGDPVLRREYRLLAKKTLQKRFDPTLLFGHLVKCVMHYHYFTMAKQMADQQSPIVNPYQ
jgi:Domain of unknown function (DUF4070)